MPMTPEFKEAWIAALRSGEYKKTTGTLYSKERDAFCCLGVACFLNGFDPQRMNQDTAALAYAYTHQEDGQEVNGFGLTENEVVKLYTFNDDLYQAGNDKDFNRVADYIEKNF